MSEARIHISLATGEIEVEGSEAFIAKYERALADLLEVLTSAPDRPVASALNEKGSDDGASSSPAGSSQLPPFGEILNQLDSDAFDTDRILIAGAYAQRINSENQFTTNDASSLLVEQGVKLSNPSQAMRSNADSKKVFRIGGRQWRTSKVGEQHLASLGVSLNQ